MKAAVEAGEMCLKPQALRGRPAAAEAERQEQTLPCSLRLALPTPRSGASGLQNRHRVHFCGLRLPGKLIRYQRSFLSGPSGPEQNWGWWGSRGIRLHGPASPLGARHLQGPQHGCSSEPVAH